MITRILFAFAFTRMLWLSSAIIAVLGSAIGSTTSKTPLPTVYVGAIALNRPRAVRDNGPYLRFANEHIGPVII